MTHSDDDGLRLPPRIAPKHVVILPVIPSDEHRSSVLEFCNKLAQDLQGLIYEGSPVVTFVDDRDLRGGDKNWQWVKKGIPLRVEVGPRDIESGTVMVARRDKAVKDRSKLAPAELKENLVSILTDIQSSLFQSAKAYRKEHTTDSIQDFEQLKEYLTPNSSDKPEIHGGFVKAKWCEDPATEERLNDLKATIRCVPFEQSGTQGKCIITGKPATKDVIIAKSY